MSLNYIGSKKTLIEFLEIPIKKIISNDDKTYTLLDGFAGTGIVGMYFKNKYNNLKVIANDLEYYSYIVNYSQLCVPYSNKLKDLFNKINEEIKKPIVLKDDFKLITNNYSLKGEEKRMFWTEQNANICDYIMYYIKNEDITEDEYKFLLGSLLCSMDKVANTASVYGAFLKKFKTTASIKMELKPIHTNHLDNSGEVYNVDINSTTILDKTYDIVYLDPPYNERQYSSNYHPLNYIAQYSNKLELYGKTGLIKDYNKSKYCQKSNAFEMLSNLITNLKTKHILLSYNNEGIMDIEQIKLLLLKQGKVILYKKVYKKFKSNTTQEDKNVFELLFHCEKGKETKKIKEIIVE